MPMLGALSRDCHDPEIFPRRLQLFALRLEHILITTFKFSGLVTRVGFAFLGTIMAGQALAQSDTAPAQNATQSDFSLQANVSLVSQYRVRGLMQTDNKPAVQGGLDLTHSSGFYVGNWNSSITWLSDSDDRVSAPVEMDFYGGYTTKVWKDLSVDLGAIRYYYPGSFPSGYVSPDTTEVYAGLGYGPVSFKYSQSVTNLFGTPGSRNSQYYDLKGSFPTGLWGLTADAHVGYQRVRGLSDGSYTDWLLGVSKGWKNGLTVSLDYIGTNANRDVYTNSKGMYMGRSTALLSATERF
jgi:uncharacterized protein (TIGR02001 family)